MPVDVAAVLEYAEVIFGNLLANASDFSAGNSKSPRARRRSTRTITARPSPFA
jgi:hypothetical protein